MDRVGAIVSIPRALAVVAALLLSAAGSAAELGSLAPSRTFIQAAATEDDTTSIAAGAAWNWRWRRDYPHASLTGYTELLVARWRTDERVERNSSDSTQFGLTPVLRISPSFARRRLFMELGIGANVITPVYRYADKRFSTPFNFGDHLGLGAELGADRQYAVTLRIEHFSNGGIKKPNPGVNFIQLRVSTSPGQFRARR